MSDLLKKKSGLGIKGVPVRTTEVQKPIGGLGKINTVRANTGINSVKGKRMNFDDEMHEFDEDL